MEDTLNKIELRSEEVQEILTAVPNWMIRWGSTLFLSLIVLIITLSWFIKYPDSIDSQGLITTKAPPQKEFAMISAKIDSIYVNDTENVTNKTVLAILENTANTEDVMYLSKILDTIEPKKDSFNFPIESIPLLFLGDIEANFARFENDYYQYQLNRRLRPYDNTALANRISISELNKRLLSLKSQYTLKESEFLFTKRDFERSKTLYQKGVISEQELEAKQLEILAAKRNIQSITQSISQTREAIGGAKNNFEDTRINRTREEIQLLKSTIQSFNQLKKAIKDWENKYMFKSEINGKVTFLNYWSKNQHVSKGDLVFTIIPTQNSSYIAKVLAPSRNSGKIKAGQSVNLKLQNYPETEFGMLKGKVEKISETPNNDGFYLVDVSLPKNLVTTYNKRIEFKQEMRADAEIITEDLRLLERFFYQFKELLE